MRNFVIGALFINKIQKKIMNSYFLNVTSEDRQNILDKHKELYNGYQSLQPVGNNSSPLYTQDFANDKEGITVNNRGEVKNYTNIGINESIEEELDEIYADDMDISDEDSAYTFKSKGPEQYEDGEKVDDYDKDYDMISKMFGMDYDGDDEGIEMAQYSERPYTGMDIESILQNMTSVEDGKEMYSGEKSAYDFDSEGPVDAWDEQSMYEEIEEELQENFKKKHSLIKEMFKRMKKF